MSSFLDQRHYTRFTLQTNHINSNIESFQKCQEGFALTFILLDCFCDRIKRLHSLQADTALRAGVPLAPKRDSVKASAPHRTAPRAIKRMSRLNDLLIFLM